MTTLTIVRVTLGVFMILLGVLVGSMYLAREHRGRDLDDIDHFLASFAIFLIVLGVLSLVVS